MAMSAGIMHIETLKWGYVHGNTRRDDELSTDCGKKTNSFISLTLQWPSSCLMYDWPYTELFVTVMSFGQYKHFD